MDTRTGILTALRSGDTVLDIGAHNGTIATDMSNAVGPSGLIVAFECHPLKFFDLSKKAALTENIRPYAQAVSNRNGHSLFYFGDAIHADQASTLCSDLALPSRLGKVSSCLVETITVDKFCKSSGIAPDFIKIDTEGGEDLVIQGARETLLKYHPVLYFEFAVPLSDKRPGVPSCFRELREMGYKLRMAEIGYLNNEWTLLHDPGNERVLVDFVDSDIETSQPTGKNILGNILAFHPSAYAERLTSFTILPLADALPLVRTLSSSMSESPKIKVDWRNQSKHWLRLWLPPVVMEVLIQLKRKASAF